MPSQTDSELLHDPRPADSGPGRRTVVAAAVMTVVGQALAVTNDLVLRQSDPPDVVLLGVLIVLSIFLLRRASWARWTVVVLVGLGGLLGLAGFALIVATATYPGTWSTLQTAAPALAGLRPAVAAFIAAPAFPYLAGSVLISALLDSAAAAMLAFSSRVRSYFARRSTTASA